ncbi:MAG TPA: universal stress protein [Halobacteriales archaeon]|nr:universal stress protein [Halobacteriales archaeon]
MTIVAAVDADDRPDRVVTVGKEMADAFGDDLVVLHVVTEAEFERRRADREYFVDQAAQDAARSAGWVVSGTLDDGEDVQTEGRVGEPADEIREFAEENDARFVVIGGRKRTPVGKAVFGSVTQSILLNADAPVVTVMD